jgi:hypothetical protein
MRTYATLTVTPYSPEMYSSLVATHHTEPHPLSMVTPRVIRDGHEVLIAHMPTDEDYRRGKRAGSILRRLMEPNVPFSLEIRDMQSAGTLAEYQLWTMPDWIRGTVGSQAANTHFLNKTLEEYQEAQNDVSDSKYDTALAEFMDLLFCISASASNNRIDLGNQVNGELNRALPAYAHRTTSKPLRFDELERYLHKFPELPLHFARSDETMASFLRNVPSSYFDPSDGMTQPSTQRQVRLYRTLLSEALACFTASHSSLVDDEYDFASEKEEAHSYAERLLTRSVLLSLLVSAHVARKGEYRLTDIVSSSMTKIANRIKSGQPVTKTT